jgi:adenosylcobinamide-GDP ribazoletransferase
VIGLALGLALVAVDRLLALAFPPLLAALLVLTAWKVATGGIHLDGLSDCLDGLAGRDVERRLAIMRDSAIGVFGALGLILCFLIGLVALADLPPAAHPRVLLLAPVVGRLAPLVAAASFGAATPGRGVGAWFLGGLPRWAAPVDLLAALGLAAALLGAAGLLLALGGLAMALAWSAFFARRLGGITGDVLGAGVEIGELAVLLAGVSLAHLRLL